MKCINQVLHLLLLFIDSFLPRLPTSISEISITSSSATIQWMLTDPYNPSLPETFIVSYGVTSGQLNMSTPGVAANPTSQTYSMQLNPLQPGTVYFYRIESRNVFGTVSTGLESFLTESGGLYCHTTNILYIKKNSFHS